MDLFKRFLTGEPAVDVESLRIKLKQDASTKRVKARIDQVSPEKVECLEIYMQELRDAGMVRFNRYATCPSLVMTVSKAFPRRGERRYRMAYGGGSSGGQVAGGIGPAANE